MKFSEILAQAQAWLQHEGRLTYRSLKREFVLDDEALEDLKFELIEGKGLAVDQDGKMLVWVGDRDKGETAKREKGETDKRIKESADNLDPSRWTPAHLAERIRAEQVALEARSGTDGERKTITALFADLKGSTALIEGLDPEEARAIIDPALQVMMDAVHRYEGYVAQALGDGIFALFGAPIAHEDHPQRALYAALRMQEEMRRYGDQVRLKHGVPLAMRVGINTGEVVVRSIRKDDLHTDYVPVGHSTNLAARMEQMATPGSILITAYTHKLTDGYFAFKALGQTQIKGVEEPLNIYEVLGTGSLRTRLQVTATRRGLTRFVGRQSEMEQLCKALEQATAGHGQIVGVMGEPGLGKSRLFYEFKLLSQTGCLILEAYSVSHGKASPYLPVIELLKSYFQIQLQNNERSRRERVIGKVLGLDRSLEDTLLYFFALMGVEDPASSLQQMDPQIRRRRTFEALKKLFLRESLNQPLILVFEDLHWIDNETQGLLDVLSESVASARILLLTNYRPEYRHEWGQKTYYTQLRLSPFGKAEAEEFLDALLGAAVGTPGNIFLQDLKRLILEKTEGTPFFMEEIVQELVEQGVLANVGTTGRSPLPTELHIPSTVQGVLAARIDRLAPEEKTFLQQLAVIGREFPVSLIRQVITQPEDELYRLLASLQRKEFLYEHPAFHDVEYTFKHALTQEVAYNSLLSERRRIVHEHAAQAMEEVYRYHLEDHYSGLAYHYSRSGNTQKAVDYLQLAGEQAVRRSANIEAISHFTAALELLGTLPETAERTQRELTLQVALGVPLLATKGFAAPEIRRTYARARTLCQQIGETPELFSALRGLWEFYHVGGELQTARTLAEQLFNIAHHAQDSSLLLEAHSTLAMTLLSLGDQTSALKHAEQLLALYNPQQHHAHAFLYGGYDPGVNCLGLIALSLWVLGYPNQALKRLSDALTLAQELSHPNSLAITQCYAAQLHQLRRESVMSQQRAEAAQALASEYGFPLAWGTILGGWARAEQGQREEGLVQMRQDLESYEATGAKGLRSYFLALIAEVYGKIGQVEEGLRALIEAMATVDKTGERWCEAELYRLKGELLLQQESQKSKACPEPSRRVKAQKSKVPPDTQHLVPNPEVDLELEAEECFLKAIEIARRQSAKSLELRAVMSLVRLRQQQAVQSESGSADHASRAKLDEAHALLSEIYNWFTEGFDTKDLQEAKALLAELSH